MNGDADTEVRGPFARDGAVITGGDDVDLRASGGQPAHGVLDERAGKVALPARKRGGEDPEAGHAGPDAAGAEPIRSARPAIRDPMRSTSARISKNKIGYATVVSRIPERQPGP